MTEPRIRGTYDEAQSSTLCLPAPLVRRLADFLPALARLRRREAQLDTGDTAWMLTSTALVLMMTIRPGIVLRRHGAQEERARHGDAEFAITRLISVLW